MGMGMSRFPDPYDTRDDLSHAAVFLIVLLLLLSVGTILFFGNAWLFAPVQIPSFLSTSANGIHAASTPRPAEPPSFSAPTPVPPLAGVPFKPTPNGTPTATPHPSAATAASKAPTPGKPTTTPPSATPARTAVPTARVGNTGGDGVYLRHTPHLSDAWIAWRDGTPLILTGAEADGDGEHWYQVRDPRGDVGWMPAQYVVR
ncbi:MAG: hypothetical protein ACRDIY_11470 [Chloroflexota bacterium]